VSERKGDIETAASTTNNKGTAAAAAVACKKSFPLQNCVPFLWVLLLLLLPLACLRVVRKLIPE